MKHLLNIGRTISYLLRHDPKDLNMDKNGYVLVDDLLKKIEVTKSDLDWIVENNDKKRFSYSEDGTKIRASQGHSIKVDTQLKTTRPPMILYHGTKLENLGSIQRTGLEKRNRLHVHLTDNLDTAHAVGKRYSKRFKPLILEINSGAMYADGFKFYLSENKVWLTDNVPFKYIKIQKL